MINIMDILSTIRHNLSSMCSHAADVVANLMAKWDELSIISNVKGNDCEFYFSEIPDSDAPAVITSIANAIDSCLDQQTFVGPSGRVFQFITTRVNGVITGLKDQLSDTQVFALGMDLNNRPFFHVTEDFPVDFNSLGDLINEMAEGISKDDIILKATNLAQRGDLTVSNFIGSINEYIPTASSALKLTIDRIRTGINSSNAYGQGGALIATLKEMFSGVQGAAFNDSTNKIEFEDNSFRVATSVFSTLGTIVGVIGRIISAALSFITPIIGAALNLIGSAVSSFIEWINANSDTSFEFVDEDKRDNDCFSIPFIQRTVPWNLVPQSYKDLISEYGLCKLTNGLFTMYIWKDQGSNKLKVEIFANARCDADYNEPGVTDLLFTQLRTFAQAGVVSDPVIGNYLQYDTTFPISGISGFVNTISHWLDSSSMPGGMAMSYDHPSLGIGGRDLLAARRFRDSFKIFTIILGTLSGVTHLSFNDEEISWDVESLVENVHGNAPAADLKVLCSMCAYMNLAYAHPSGTTQYHPVYPVHDNVSINDFPYGDRSSVAGIVNYGLPIMRELFNNLSDATFVEFLNAWQFGFSGFSASAEDLGCGSKLIVSDAITCKGNAYVIPPKTKFSVLYRYAANTALVAAVAAAGVASFIAVKRRISFNIEKARSRTEEALVNFQNDPSLTNYRKYRRKVRQYNWFWGKLNGTTYDVNNQWVDYNDDTDLSASGTSIILDKIIG